MIGMKVEDRLDETSNFNSKKSRVLLILEENDLLKFVNEKVLLSHTLLLGYHDAAVGHFLFFLSQSYT